MEVIFKAMVLGFVQGATEFIPISSSAHLIIVPWLFGWTDPALTSLGFDVALHLGSLVALLVFFATDWLRLAKAFVRSVLERRIGTDPDRRLAWLVLIGTLPGGLAGLFLEGRIEALFHQAGLPVSPAKMIAMALIIALFGVLLLLADRFGRNQADMQDLTLKDTLLIGLSQALAIFPGVSRSGATISAGLALGLEREAATTFSFLLSAPIILAAGVKSLLGTFSGLQAATTAGPGLAALIAGFLAAALSGFLCIRFLMNYLQTNNMKVFVFYRWALALLILLAALSG